MRKIPTWLKGLIRTYLLAAVALASCLLVFGMPHLRWAHSEAVYKGTKRRILLNCTYVSVTGAKTVRPSGWADCPVVKLFPLPASAAVEDAFDGFLSRFTSRPDDGCETPAPRNCADPKSDLDRVLCGGLY
jgi:hypothetical protein